MYKNKKGDFRKMIREILHKAKDERGRWIYGYFCYNPHSGRPCIQSNTTYILHGIIPETVCQLTYMKDKDDNEIWENDIIETENRFLLQCVWSEEYHEFLFKNIKGGYDFMVGMISELSSFTKGDIKIVGNIYDEIECVRKVG